MPIEAVLVALYVHLQQHEQTTSGGTDAKSSCPHNHNLHHMGCIYDERDGAFMDIVAASVAQHLNAMLAARELLWSQLMLK